MYKNKDESVLVDARNKGKAFKTFYSFDNLEAFEAFLRTKEWKSGELDYVTMGGSVYTIHEYDMAGQSMSWGNAKRNELIDCTTENRYSSLGFKDAKLFLFENYGLLRDDIHYQE